MKSFQGVLFLGLLVVLGVSGGPCDIYKNDGNDCVAAHSTVRALYDSYKGTSSYFFFSFFSSAFSKFPSLTKTFKGPLYQVQRTDGETKDIYVLSSGVADSDSQDRFLFLFFLFPVWLLCCCVMKHHGVESLHTPK